MKIDTIFDGDATALRALLTRACEDTRNEVGVGRVADYIPALARIDPHKFGAAIMTVDGDLATYGDAAEAFSVQSISKIFTLLLALRRVGEPLWERVGREPSGSAFNSIVQLEAERGLPRNPLINAGALVLSDVLLAGRTGEAVIAEILQCVRQLADDDGIGVDEEVASSEADSGYRNRSLANFLKGFGNLHGEVDEVLRVYFNHCAISMNCQQLARAALPFALRGRDPVTGEQLFDPGNIRRINSVMLMCGHYDASGEFAFRVGLPGKSGVGGGIVAIVPQRASIAVWSPALNASGNSHAGTLALERIVRAAGWSVL